MKHPLMYVQYEENTNSFCTGMVADVEPVLLERAIALLVKAAHKRGASLAGVLQQLEQVPNEPSEGTREMPPPVIIAARGGD